MKYHLRLERPLARSLPITRRVPKLASMLLSVMAVLPLLVACRLPKRDKWQLPDAAEAGFASQAESETLPSYSDGEDKTASRPEEIHSALIDGRPKPQPEAAISVTNRPPIQTKSGSDAGMSPSAHGNMPQVDQLAELPSTSGPLSERASPEYPTLPPTASLIPEAMQLVTKTTEAIPRDENLGNPLKLRIAGVDPDQGPVRVAVFTEAAAFPNYQQASKKAVLPSASTTLHGEIDGVKAGNAAIAVYQDLNNDGQLNRSSYGIPTEPYGFSNNAQGKMGPPSFAAAQVQIGTNSTVIPISLTKLKF